MSTKIKHLESGEILDIIVMGTMGNWVYSSDGYQYDLRYWEVQ